MVGYRQRPMPYCPGIGRKCRWLAVGDPVDNALADEDGRRVHATAAQYLRDNGGVGNPKPLHSLDPAMLVDDGIGVGVGPHSAGARHVPGGAHSLAHIQVQRVIVLQGLIGRSDAVIEYVLVCRRLQ